MRQSPLLSGGPVELCATVPSTHARYTVTAARDRLRDEALALRELLMTHGLSSLEKPFPEAQWLRRDGSDADCLDAQLLVSINHLQIAGYPGGGLAGRVFTDAMPICWLEGNLQIRVPGQRDISHDLDALLARIAGGLSTAADAQALRALLSPSAEPLQAAAA